MEKERDWKPGDIVCFWDQYSGIHVYKVLSEKQFLNINRTIIYRPYTKSQLNHIKSKDGIYLRKYNKSLTAFVKSGPRGLGWDIGNNLTRLGRCIKTIRILYGPK